MKAKLNTKYFTNRGFIYNTIPKQIREILVKLNETYVIEESNLTNIFIKGENIEGKWTPQSPLIINLYFADLNATEDYFKNLMRELEKELKRDSRIANLKIELEYNLDPKTLPEYYDLEKDRLILNREYLEYLKKPKSKKILVEAPIEEEQIIEEQVKTEPLTPIQKKTSKKKSVRKRTEEEIEAKKEETRSSREKKVPENFEPFIEKPFPEATIIDTIGSESKKIYAYTKENLEEAKEWIDIKMGLKEKENSKKEEKKED